MGGSSRIGEKAKALSRGSEGPGPFFKKTGSVTNPAEEESESSSRLSQVSQRKVPRPNAPRREQSSGSGAAKSVTSKQLSSKAKRLAKEVASAYGDEEEPSSAGSLKRRMETRVQVKGNETGKEGQGSKSTASKPVELEVAQSPDLALQAQTRRILAVWLSEQSGLRIRAFSEEAFVNDIRDGIALCVILDNLGWLAAEKAGKVYISTDRHTLPRRKKGVNLAIVAETLRDHDIVPEFPSTLNEINAATLNSQILPALTALMASALKAPKPAQDEAIPSERAKSRKRAKKKIKQIIRHEIKREKLPVKHPLEEEDIDQVLSSIFAVVIFTVIIIVILSVVSGVLGLTETAIWTFISGRKTAPQVLHSDVTWYSDVKQVW
mmetsp:Transcript_17526/g.32181  ORF Transcript_17526/g.32181 Transcript_17526/m.32181 type:complete len:379 (-) Transcript_17526:118-1254(-)